MILAIILVLINICAVSATEITSDNATLSQDSNLYDLEISDGPLYCNDKTPDNQLNSNCQLDSDEAESPNLQENPDSQVNPDGQIYDDEIPDVPDLVDREYMYIYQSNIGSFFPDGVLDKRLEGKNLILSGKFENIGKLSIGCNNVFICGQDAELKNTVFALNGNNITLKDIKFNLNSPVKDNKGAAVLVGGDDISLLSLDINYTVPTDMEAYAILTQDESYFYNLRIINSSIYFEGHNDNVNRYNCAVKLIDAYDSIMENNTIITSLPLKNIIYGTGDATIDSEYVYAVGIERCDGFIFNNNTVISDVNKRTAVEYPTQVAFLISKSDDVVVLNNSIYMSDFVTYPGVENFLYGIDIHNANSLLIANNTVSMVTTGGKLALGTAYPIQVSGPSSDIVITENDLYSFSNGPNIGIYSQNAFGQTSLYITYNRINVTGLAGTHSWALVTGIESQDTFADISNNIIEVHSVAEVNPDDNLYAISYLQSTDAYHGYNIENNIAFTDGYYSVFLLASQYSNIFNNTLVSFNENAKTGDDAYRPGPRSHYGDFDEDNRVIRAMDYFPANNNDIDNGDEIVIDSSASSSINTNGIAPKGQGSGSGVNPSIPSYRDMSDISRDSKETSTEYIDDGSTQGIIADENLDNHNSNNNPADDVNYNGDALSADVYGDSHGANSEGGKINQSNVNGSDLDIPSNSSSTSPSPGTGVNPLLASQDSGPSASKSVMKKAFKLEKLVNNDRSVMQILLIAAALILLVIGYYKRKSKENI